MFGSATQPSTPLRGENLAVLEHRLQNSKRPAEALAHQAAGIDRSFGVGERAVFVLHAVSAAQQRHGKIGILGNGIGLVAAGFAHRRYPPRANRSRDHADRTQRVQRPALEILAGDVLQRLPAGPQDSPGCRPWHCRRGRRPWDCGSAGPSAKSRRGAITVSASMPTKISSSGSRRRRPKLRAAALPALGLVRISRRPGRFFLRKATAGDFEGLVRRAIVNHDDPQIAVTRAQGRANGPLDDFLFVVCGDKHRHSGAMEVAVPASALRFAGGRDHRSQRCPQTASARSSASRRGKRPGQ